MTTNSIKEIQPYHRTKRQICELLIHEWSRKDRLPPIKDLAKRLGAGQRNTHLAIQELVHEGLLISRPKLGTIICENISNLRPRLENIVRNCLDQSLVTPIVGKKVKLISHQSSENEAFLSRPFSTFISEASRMGCRISQLFIDEHNKIPLNKVVEDDVDSIVVVNPSRSLIIDCHPSQILVIISSTPDLQLAATDRYDLISIDNNQGSCLAGRFIRQCGWKEVCFIGVCSRENPQGKIYDKTSQERLKGLILGLGCPVANQNLIHVEGYSNLNGVQAASEWLRLHPRPPAIFASSDELAFGFIHGAYAHGLLPGKDYQIIGFDGQQRTPDKTIGTLTTIAVPMEEMGTLAGKMLLERFEKPNLTPRRIYLGCLLKQGNTFISQCPTQS